MTDRSPPPEATTAPIHPDRAEMLKTEEDKEIKLEPEPEPEPARTRCSNCKRSHSGTCTATSCTRCEKFHIPELNWCDHCRRCAKHSTEECTKKFADADDQAKPHLTTIPREKQAVDEMSKTTIDLSDLTPREIRYFIAAVTVGSRMSKGRVESDRVEKRRYHRVKKYEDEEDDGVKKEVIVKKEE